MSSFQNIMVVVLLSLSSLTSASPIATRCLSLPTNIVIPSTLPLIAGPASPALPFPLPGLTLKHVTIGHGIQNYTCANTSSIPLAIGAIATLYDVTAISFLSPVTVSLIPPITALQPLTNTLIPSRPLTIPGLGSFPILGFHYFTSNGTPTFDLTSVGERLFASKLAGIKAPGNASTGVLKTGAVDWLALGEVQGMGSVGLKEVYRVDTAGGVAPKTCAGVVEGGVVSVPYSASYQFFG